MRPLSLCWTPGIRKCSSSAAINKECWTIAGAAGATGTPSPGDPSGGGDRRHLLSPGPVEQCQESWTLTWMVRDGAWDLGH